ncbi:hypothetical protein BLD44_021470 [Mastigocladus laminosus UU774]|nr:hypothetical protein BLD44_021470 [Mastigocladus laminosus UU774]
MSLTSNEVGHFYKYGFFFPIDTISEEEAREFVKDLHGYEIIISNSGSEFLKIHKDFPKIHLLTTWADKLVHEPRILDAVESIVGPNILAWSSGIFTRLAGSNAQIAWHQDVAYFGLDNFERAVRVWIALTPTNPENGTMRFAPGTHRHGIKEHAYAGRDAEAIAQGEQVLLPVDESQTVDVVLRAGQCSFHHLAIAHASGPSRASIDRINFTIDYIAPDVRPLTSPDSALLVRGHDICNYYAPEVRPRKDFGEAELESYFRAVRTRDRRILDTMRKHTKVTTI